MDRNYFHQEFRSKIYVALLAEGVDRNAMLALRPLICASVALLAEGVDRNISRIPPALWRASSPSSRRAWIEIQAQDRAVGAYRSPSSRRAWIEMSQQMLKNSKLYVALLAEGVDRNSRGIEGVSMVFSVALLAEGVDRNGRAGSNERKH